MGKKIILVDDSATVLMTAEMACSELIKVNAIELVTYSDPLELLEDVNKKGVTYDLLITDINMPQMNGFELAKALKANLNVKAKPIIALTTENSDEMKAKGKEVGLVGWITKPFSNDKLIMGIKRILRIG
jgi:two-component system chemotaxis response regulator CheY